MNEEKILNDDVKNGVTLLTTGLITGLGVKTAIFLFKIASQVVKEAVKE